MTSPRRGTRRWRGPRAITRSGSMPTTSSSRPSARSCVGLAGWASSAEPRRLPYVVNCACDPGEDGSGGETVVDHIRLFPMREEIRWTYRVHEQILPALRRAKVPVRWTDLTVRHTGYSDRAMRARKLVRDTRILRDELDDRPDDPFVLFNLGAIAVERQDLARGAGAAAPQPGRVGADRLDHAEALRLDRPGPPDARRASAGAGRLRRRAGAGPGRRRAALPRGGGPPTHRRPGRAPSVAGSGSSRSAGPSSSPASTRGSTATSPAATSPPWPPSAATTTRPIVSGPRCWPSVPATARRWRRAVACRRWSESDDPLLAKGRPGGVNPHHDRGSFATRSRKSHEPAPPAVRLDPLLPRPIQRRGPGDPRGARARWPRGAGIAAH